MTAPNALDRLRDKLVRSSQVGKLKLDATFLRRERDRLVQRLGEAALGLLETGELAEHPGLEDTLIEIRAVSRKLEATAQQIDEIQHESDAPPVDAPDPKVE